MQMSTQVLPVNLRFIPVGRLPLFYCVVAVLRCGQLSSLGLIRGANDGA
jgi:hypothetical protein